MKLLGIISLLLAGQESSAFHFGQMEAKRISALKAAGAGLPSSSSGEEGNNSRRDFMIRTGAAALSITSGSGLGFGVWAPPAANAVGGVGKVDARLKA